MGMRCAWCRRRRRQVSPLPQPLLLAAAAAAAACRCGCCRVLLKSAHACCSLSNSKKTSGAAAGARCHCWSGHPRLGLPPPPSPPYTSQAATPTVLDAEHVGGAMIPHTYIHPPTVLHLHCLVPQAEHAGGAVQGEDGQAAHPAHRDADTAGPNIQAAHRCRGWGGRVCCCARCRWCCELRPLLRTATAVVAVLSSCRHLPPAPPPPLRLACESACLDFVLALPLLHCYAPINPTQSAASLLTKPSLPPAPSHPFLTTSLPLQTTAPSANGRRYSSPPATTPATTSSG